MKNKITSSILLLVPLFVFGQTIDNFDALPEADYWGYEISENADSTLSFVNVSYITDPVTEGDGAMQLDYSAHNIEAWGGYAKIFHMLGGSDDESGSPIEGTWKMAPEAGALMVGPAANDGSWWSNSEDDVVTRACYFDDEYVFNADGSFNNVLQDTTWLETWQGVAADGCGTPVAPHDGSNAATWEFDSGAGTVTLDGVGAYLGLPKAWNGGELSDPADAPDSIIYNITLSDNNNTMTLVIECGTGVFWTFKLVADEEAPVLSGTWKMAPEAGALMVGPAANDGSWWSNSEDDVVTRACYFDDEYVFSADGSFQNVLQDTTWLETWQGVTADGCGTPVAPHDGSNAATWEYNAGTGTVTLTGVGAYLGLPKAWNGGELSDPADAPESITYNATLSDNNTTMTLVIECGTGVFWTFKLVADDSQQAIAYEWDNENVWDTAFDWDATFDNGTALFSMLPDEGAVWDWSGYDSISFSYYNSIPQSLADRIHLRLNLSDYGDVADPANYDGLGEYYYSFHYILDNASGWNTITMPLERTDDWAGVGFNLTGWAGDPGNGDLDKHAIAGFHLEFSISGGGDGDYSEGTIILDDFKLTGTKNVLTNPGFELADEQDDGFGWGAAMGGGHAEVVTDASVAYNGDNYLSIGVDDANWAIFYTEDSIPAQFGETWRFSGYGVDLAGDGGGAAFKLEAKDAGGTVLGTTGDVALAMTNDWENHSIEFVMPEGTVQMAAVIVASRWDGVACDFAFDDMFLMSMGVLDVIPPVAVTGVSATPYSYYNLVTWTDNDGEEGETYNVYASTEPITDSLSLSTADVVGTNVLEGTQAAVHYLHNPLEDADVTYYYAVVCKDGSNNVGEPGSSDDPITNTAKGVPTISFTPPAAFAADGDLSEWYDSGIVPFELGATDNSYGTPHLGFGAVDDDNDLYGTIFTAVDDDYFYLAAEIMDNVVNNDDSGGWWTADVVQLCFGFYDQRGPKHVGMQRGAEPDYKMYFTPAGANSDNGAGVLAEHGDGNYFHEVYDPDYVFEFRMSLDSILIDDDVRLIPTAGMRTPFEPMVYDNDGDGLEAIMVLSHTNDDNAHQTCEVWSNTWIGGSSVGIGDEILPLTYALHPNYPNPFNPVTNIQFTIPEQADVKLQIYNVLGRQVDVLVNETLPIGHHKILWNPKNLSSGVYFYKLEAGSFMKTRKMILLK
ncbi:MAG: T9SS type A sorting domain-containing protein [Candidatus Marinimicrobia bacterium]|nr:T9SS type A sorting domain-containing protein [Candidatus Neomarinimicrobiota bacterium]